MNTFTCSLCGQTHSNGVIMDNDFYCHECGNKRQFDIDSYDPNEEYEDERRYDNGSQLSDYTEAEMEHLREDTQPFIKQMNGVWVLWVNNEPEFDHVDEHIVRDYANDHGFIVNNMV